MDAPLRVLLVEDSEDDALLLLRELRRGGYDPLCERVETPEAMQAALDGREWDLVISDHSMPAFSSSAALRLLHEKGLDLPFVIVSGQIGEDAAVAAMRVGAHDYIMKDNLARLNTAIERELREAEVRRERRRAEQELLVSETRFRLMVEQAPLAIGMLSPDGRMLRINRAMEKLWGVTLEQVMEYNPDYNLLEDEQLETKGIMGYLERGFAGEATAVPPILYDPLPATGVDRPRWVRSVVYPVKDEAGEILEVVLMQEDITESREAEEARRRAEEKYRGIFENAVEGIFQTTVEGRFLTANPALARMFGYESPDELLEHVRSIGDELYVDPERREEFDRLIQRDGTVSGFEVQMHRGDGGTMWASTSARAVRDAEGEVVGYEGTVEDITERKRIEETLREVREAERRRIARDLHDETLQDLTYVLQSMQLVRRMPELAEQRDGEPDRQISALRRALGGLREAIYDLRLEGAREEPFVRSLESLVELNRQMAPEREIELVVEEGFPEDLAGTAGAEMLRIVKEALANIRRHSGARRARVTLGTSADGVWAEVTDDGRGFAPGTVRGTGLTGMKERALALGGELEVESEEGAGTRVRLRIVPVAREADPPET